MSLYFLVGVTGFARLRAELWRGKTCPPAAFLTRALQILPSISKTQKGTQSVPFCVLVGMTGFEPATSCSQSRRATNCATSRNIIKNKRHALRVFCFGGEGEIRTLEPISGLHDFQSCALDQLRDFSICRFCSQRYVLYHASLLLSICKNKK